MATNVFAHVQCNLGYLIFFVLQKPRITLYDLCINSLVQGWSPGAWSARDPCEQRESDRGHDRDGANGLVCPGERRAHARKDSAQQVLK